MRDACRQAGWVLLVQGLGGAGVPADAIVVGVERLDKVLFWCGYHRYMFSDLETYVVCLLKDDFEVVLVVHQGLDHLLTKVPAYTISIPLCLMCSLCTVSNFTCRLNRPSSV